MLQVTVRKEDEQTSSKDYYDMHSPMVGLFDDRV